MFHIRCIVYENYYYYLNVISIPSFYAVILEKKIFISKNCHLYIYKKCNKYLRKPINYFILFYTYLISYPSINSLRTILEMMEEDPGIRGHYSSMQYAAV